MTAAAKTPLWKRLVIVVSAVAVGIVVASAVGQAGVSTVLTIALGAGVTLFALWAVAKLLRVPLTRGWE